MSADLEIPYAFGVDDLSVVRPYTRDGVSVRLGGRVPGRAAHYEGKVDGQAVSVWIVTPGAERVVELTDAARAHLLKVYGEGVVTLSKGRAT